MKKLLLVLISALSFSISAWAAVDLNTASQAELETVKGIGPAKAKAIVEFRKKNGDFRSVNDLDKVPGFGKKTLDMVKKDITVGNATAAAAGKTADFKSVKEENVKEMKIEKKDAREETKAEKKHGKKK